MHEERIAYSVPEAAKIVGYQRGAIYKGIREGTLKAYQAGGKGEFRILRDDLIAWLKNESSAEAAPV
jgi:excisionase family DNA binding protein